MNITETFYAPDRDTWRAWLEQYHAEKQEIWLVSYKANAGQPSVSYLDSVLEALCFGWIDGIAKNMDADRSAQRFTPRRKNSSWTELNKERARRLIAAGRMTDAGRAVLPDLDVKAFQIAPDILAALQADGETWANFQTFSDVYQRIRIGYIEEQRTNKAEFDKRLENFLKKTKQNKQFGGVE
jgi:uncharacterized protein YdeI (YjbR/CyaY-like superfamily)